eukprot:RCo044924
MTDTLPPLNPSPVRRDVPRPKPHLSYVGNRLLLCSNKEEEKHFRGKLREHQATESRVHTMKQIREVEQEGQWKRALHHRQARQWLCGPHGTQGFATVTEAEPLSGHDSGFDSASPSSKELGESSPHSQQPRPIPLKANGEVLLAMDQVRVEHSQIRAERAQAKQWVVEMHQRLLHEERAQRVQA